MTWNSTWPLGSASVKANRLTGNQNTSYIESTLKVNHYFNESPAGKHKFVSLPIYVDPGTAAGEGAVYTKNVTDPILGSSPELFYRRESNGSPIQLSGVTADVMNGRTYILNGLLFQWGQSTQSTNGIVKFPVTFTGNPFSIQCTVLLNTTSRLFIQVMTISATQFTVACRDSGGSDTSITFSWMAIAQN